MYTFLNTELVQLCARSCIQMVPMNIYIQNELDIIFIVMLLILEFISLFLIIKLHYLQH
jgi:hypothetical protein